MRGAASIGLAIDTLDRNAVDVNSLGLYRVAFVVHIAVDCQLIGRGVAVPYILGTMKSYSARALTQL